MPESMFNFSSMEPIGELLPSGFSSQGMEPQFFSDSRFVSDIGTAECCEHGSILTAKRRRAR
jgi:hypothetical protein